MTTRADLSDAALALLDVVDPGEVFARRDILEPAEISVSQWQRAIGEVIEHGFVERVPRRRGAYRRLDHVDHDADEPSPSESASASPAPSRGEPKSSPRRRGGRYQLHPDALRAKIGVEEGEGDALVTMLASRGLPPLFWPAISALANGAGGAVVLGALERTPERIYIKGARHPRAIMEEIQAAPGARDPLSRTDGRLLHIDLCKVMRRKVIVARIRGHIEGMRPVYVGESSYDRHPDKGTFVLREGRPVKARDSHIDALWERWAEPYEVIDAPTDPHEDDEEDDVDIDQQLLEDIAGPAQRHPELNARRMRELVVRACGVTPMTLEGLAELFDRDTDAMARHLEVLTDRERLDLVDGHYVVHTMQLEVTGEG